MDTKVRTRETVKEGERTLLRAAAKKVLIESYSHTVPWPRSAKEIKQED